MNKTNWNFLKALLASLSFAALPLSTLAAASADLPVEARGPVLLLKLSGEQDKLAADVSYASFSSGPRRMEAIRAGSAQVGIVGDVPPILAHYAGVDLRIVGVVASTGPSLLITTS